MFYITSLEDLDSRIVTDSVFSMPSSCKACHHKVGPGLLYTFPRTQPALNNWKLALKIPEKDAVTNMRVCSKHFSTDNMSAVLKIDYDLKDKDGKFL